MYDDVLVGLREETRQGEAPVRAGALTLLFLSSNQRRPSLQRMLNEAASGANVVEDELTGEPDLILDVDEDANEIEDPVELAERSMERYREAGILEPTDPNEPPGPDRMMQASSAGRDANVAGLELVRWLQDAPRETLAIGMPRAAEACMGLFFGWVSTVVHRLALCPLSLEELRSTLPELKPIALRLYVDVMESAGQLEAVAGEDGVVRYRPTEWLRRAIGPLIAGARVECRHPRDDTAPPDSLDSIAAFMLALPLLELPPEPSGTCRLGVVVAEDGPPRAEGVTAHVAGGRIVSVSQGLAEDADAWAVADAGDWMDTVIEPDAKRVKTGGNKHLARVILDGLHETLFPARRDA